MKLPSPCHALWIATLLPFVCTGATIEERLKELETKVTQLSAENAALKKQVGLNDKGTGPALVTVAGKEKSLSIGGYLQVNGEAGEAADARFPANDRLLIRRARITLKGAFAEGFDFVFQSDFGNNSIGGVSGYRAQITDLAVSWSKYYARHPHRRSIQDAVRLRTTAGRHPRLSRLSARCPTTRSRSPARSAPCCRAPPPTSASVTPPACSTATA
jgi:hypothetical protein